MDEISEKFSGADPFQSWWPFVVALGVGVLMTIRLVSLSPTVINSNIKNLAILQLCAECLNGSG